MDLFGVVLEHSGKTMIEAQLAQLTLISLPRSRYFFIKMNFALKSLFIVYHSAG